MAQCSWAGGGARLAGVKVKGSVVALVSSYWQQCGRQQPRWQPPLLSRTACPCPVLSCPDPPPAIAMAWMDSRVLNLDIDTLGKLLPRLSVRLQSPDKAATSIRIKKDL